MLQTIHKSHLLCFDISFCPTLQRRSAQASKQASKRFYCS